MDRFDPVRLQEAMARHGYTQADLAERLDLQRVTVSRWMNGHREPHPVRIRQMARILQVSEAYLTGAEPETETAADAFRRAKAICRSCAGEWTGKQKGELIRLLAGRIE